jgi:hypothetical protein
MGAVFCVAANRRAPFNALAGLSVVALTGLFGVRSPEGQVIFAGRSFFGILRVVEAADHSYRSLLHGTTRHGRQNLPNQSACEPVTYYDSAGPVGDLFRRSGRHFADVAVLGLGTGGLACYAEPGSRWTFFEIDPLVERIARDASLFTFLPHSAGRIDIAIGDGRKGIERAAPGSYDLIVADAFSSDAIPVHMLTREAVDTYVSRLRPGGLLALHISNRFLDLEPVVSSVAAEEHVPALTNLDARFSPADAQRGRVPTQWVVLARVADSLTMIGAIPGWHPLAPRGGVPPWTDDYSNLLRSIRWR